MSTISASTTTTTAYQVSADTTGALVFQTGATPTTGLTIDTGQRSKFPTTIGVGGATPSTSGSGISFPATQSASSDANTLDDYEEGSWTPNQGDGLTVVGTFSSSGNYTKVGRMIYVRGVVQASSSISCSSGTTITKNLPFTTFAGTDNSGAGFNGSLLAGTVLDFVNLNVYTTAAMASSTVLFFSGTYQTA